VENFLMDQSATTGKSVEELKKELDALHPIGHIGEPNDIAYGVLYLVSDEAKFVTGSELIIDGGYTTT
jgi:NAD(P)-dependent dehydrogenase (short-subunit alcohol dehydrogenase family)